jgi:hypothetical protein
MNEKELAERELAEETEDLGGNPQAVGIVRLPKT